MRFAVGCALVVSMFAVSCTKSERAGGPKKPQPSVPPITAKVTAAISAVNLADDCQHADARSAKPMAEAAAGESMMAADCGGENCGMPCQQTSMQLALESVGAVPTRVKVVSVELFDVADGTSLGAMNPRDPQRWSDAEGGYQVWDETLKGGDKARVMFLLSAPDWNKVGGRWSAQNRTFRLKVTLDLDGQQKTIEKVESADLMIEPQVVT